MPNIPTIAVKESRAALLEIGPSTGLSGFRLVYVIGKGLYQWQTGDQSGNVPGGNGGDNWIAPSEDTSGKSGAWERLTPENTTGVDGNVVTGTAGTNGNLSEWNADGDLVDSSVAGSDVLVKPGTSSDPALAFDTWRTPNANRPVLVSVELSAFTGGTTEGRIHPEVDESGGTTADYTYKAVVADPDTTSGNATMRTLATFLVPAGGSYRIVNDSDPLSANAIGAHREFTE